MDYLAALTITVPAGTTQQTVEETRAREAVRAKELAAAGCLRRLWRPPHEDGEWVTWGIFNGPTEQDVRAAIASLPLHPWMQVTLTPLAPHPNDPGLGAVPSPAAASAI